MGQVGCGVEIGVWCGGNRRGVVVAMCGGALSSGNRHGVGFGVWVLCVASLVVFLK